MKAVPAYTKVLTLGASYTENALSGAVVIQEKLDGSQFGFGFNEDGDFVMRSKSVALFETNHAEMFARAVAHALVLPEKLKLSGQLTPDTYFYCEFLDKPKHNTLSYGRVPKNHLALFDVLQQGRWVERNELEAWAAVIEIEPIPELYRGSATVEQIKNLLKTPSVLGNEILEGVVIKNYSQTVSLGGVIFPLFTKYVREEFKERHATDWKIRQPKGTLQEFIDGFKTEARWQKAWQYLRDRGDIENHPRDIEKLMKRVRADITEEEEENIKQHLYKCFSDDIMRTATKGLPEWYKNKLLENIKTDDTGTEL